MSISLERILREGHVLDNTSHVVQDCSFSAGHLGVPVEVWDGNGAASQWRAWQFLAKINTELNKRLKSREHAELVVFPGQDYEHNTTDDLIRMPAGGDCKNFSFSTGNLIGCVSGRFDGYRFTLHVSSRFGDEFLKYIIADADGFLELPDKGGTKSEGYEWLLCHLWLIKLKKAFRLGLPKAYETRRESLPLVRGRLDVVDYFRNHERARYACAYREHSYDNGATRLIARTLEHLDSRSMLHDAHHLNQTFQSATEGRRHTLKALLSAPQVRNPYYADYNLVMTLAKRILRNDLADFGDNDRTSAFFFDVSMLFEYFIRKLLRRAGMMLRDKTGCTWSIPRGQQNPNATRELVPDLVFDFDGRSFVFDVKYKRFDFQDGVKREDHFQLHTYIGQAANESEVAGCGFIYPIRESRWNDKNLDACGGIWTSTITQGGREIPFHVVFLKIPEQEAVPDDDWPQIFRERFKLITKDFVTHLLERLVGGAKVPQLSGLLQHFGQRRGEINYQNELIRS